MAKFTVELQTEDLSAQGSFSEGITSNYWLLLAPSHNLHNIILQRLSLGAVAKRTNELPKHIIQIHSLKYLIYFHIYGNIDIWTLKLQYYNFHLSHKKLV